MKASHLPNLPETSKNSPLKVYCDANTQGEEHISGAGWALATHYGEVVCTEHEQLGKGYDSVAAETSAIERISNILTNHQHIEHIKLLSDCRPAIRSCDEGELSRLFEQFTIEWVPRERNQVADMASRLAIEKYEPDK